jgi:uncharacterized protein YbcI
LPFSSEKNSGELLAAISNVVVAIYADHLGRGPTKARTYLSGGVITCLLEDTLTRAEQRLIGVHRDATVLELRANLQEMMAAEMIAAVETLTRHRVRALISGTQLEPDVSSQVFLLDGKTALDSEVSNDGRGAGFADGSVL